MKHTLKFETEIENGKRTERNYIDGEEMALYRISRILTQTEGENSDGIFTNGIVRFVVGLDEHIFNFAPEQPIQERVDEVRGCFRRDDKKTCIELEVDDRQPEAELKQE